MKQLSERGRAATLGAVGLCSLLAGAPLAAHENAAVQLSLWTSDAPIASVLEQVVGSDVFEVRVGDGVAGLVSGRLEGSVSEVLASLLDRYRLGMYNDGSTVWFDRSDREVVELIELDPEREPALAEWAARELDENLPGRKGTVSLEGATLRIAGSRPFVQNSLSRFNAAQGALGETDVRIASERPSDADAGVDTEAGFEDDPAVLAADADEPEAVAAMSVWREPPEALAMPDADSPAGEDELAREGPPFRSVTDIPGFDTEYR